MDLSILHALFLWTVIHSQDHRMQNLVLCIHRHDRVSLDTDAQRLNGLDPCF